jgi:solute carrier family 25 (mitochondrial iron transporter), member 28/37
MYFSTYEAVKAALGVRRSQHAPVATAAAGAMATVVNDAFMTPGDVVKQRLQIANSPYKGMLHCIASTYRQEGLRAFFRSYKTTVWRWTASSVLCWRRHAAAVGKRVLAAGSLQAP